MDPRDPHYNGGHPRSRYDYDPPFPLPPPPPPHHQFSDQPPPHNHYPHPQFHPPPRPPPPRHHHHHQFSDDASLYFPPPPPPLPYGHPPPPPPPRASSRGGPHHHHEPWDGPDPRKVTAFDDWDHRDLERRRYRMREDGILEEEEFRDRAPPPHRQQQQVNRLRMREDGILEEDYSPRARRSLSFERRTSVPMQISPSPPPPPPARSYDVEGNSAGMSAAEIGFQATRYGEGAFRATRYSEEGCQGNRYSEEGYQENHYIGNKGKRKWVNIGSEDGDDRYQENHYKGKRWNFNGGSPQYNNEWGSARRSGQKTSALGRIRSGISVWNRLEEKPSSPSSHRVFPHLGFEGDSQPELDSLDLSYKSNTLVAKVVEPSSPDPQLYTEGTSPRVVVPKDRMKTKKVAKGREKVVIPIVRSLVVSRAGEGMSKKPVSSSSQVSNLSEGSKVERGSSSKPASDGSKKESGSSGKSASNVSKPATERLRKAPGSSCKPAGDISKKASGSSSKPPSDGLKKLNGSSTKPAGSCSPQPLAKKMPKVASVKRVAAKRALKTVEENMSADCRQEDRVGESKPTNCMSSLFIQPGPAFVTTVIDNSASQQSRKGADFVYWPMEVVPSNENSAPEPSPNYGIENSVTERSSKDVQLVHGPMVVSTDNNAVKRSINDADFAQTPMVGTTSEKYLMEQSDKDVNIVHESIESTSSIENKALEQSCKDANVVWDNVVNDTVKEETMALIEKIAPHFTSPDVSGSRIVIDISSESSPEEFTRIRSPSKAMCSVNDINPNDSIKEMDSGNTESDGKLAMRSFTECSSFELVGDAQDMEQVIMPVVTSPKICGSLKDDNAKRKGEEIAKQQKLEVPSVTDELDVLAEQMKEDSDVLPSDVSNLVQDRNPLSGATDEDYDLRLPNRGLPISDSIPILEDRSVNVATSERVEQLLPFSPSVKGTSLDVSTAQYASNLTEQSNSHLSESKCRGDNDSINKQEEKPTSNNDSLFKRSLASVAEPDRQLDRTMTYHHPTSEKTQLIQSYEPKKQISADAKLTGVVTSTKFIVSSGVPRVFTNQTSAGSLKETAHSSRNPRNTTWHRTDTPSSLPLHGNLQNKGGIYKQSARKQSPKKLGRVPNSSYVRKGNALIRKPASVVPGPILHHGLDASSRNNHLTERSMTLGSMDNNSNHKTCSNPSLERPKTPPLSLGSKISPCTVITQKEFPQLVSEDPISEPGVEAQAKPAEGQTFDLLSGSVDNLSSTSGIRPEPLTRKRMTYVKHKSNQLVFAPPSDFGDSTHPTETAEKLSSSTASDLYYMRKKNQLILNASTSDSKLKQDGMGAVYKLKSDGQGTSNTFSLESSRTGPFKKRIDKVLRKTNKQSKLSRVWTLGGAQSGKKGVTSVNRWKVMPDLFPWKRTAYSNFSLNRTAMNSNRGSLSFISRKLQLTRKRDTIYTVSTDGFSLRKAGVVSIGGSSLKWSKSIERHSKRANEQATLAVTEAEGKKRERKRKRSIGSRGKHSFTRKATLGIQLLQGERIYRVGSVRYKMDASKRTLMRIPDEQLPGAVSQQIGKNAVVPRRLLIGNDEYIRIGNGNKLVRDPKKLIRILASEKIRWSLHTARLRLAKKQQYCQFFTRFGKCNKNAGKCPYIHDPEKVAICTKFLGGVCTDANCKLTHQIIPERMPDCSYFLQGLCTNINCPYRHVHVNPKASVCEGFLRGYCADGDECRKKHSYVCPLFEATGMCPQGSKCKLHHPKSRNKSKKWKHAEMQSSNSRGRYFGSKILKVGEPLVVASDKCAIERDADPFCCGRRFVEFISTDVGSDNDGVETSVPKDFDTKEVDSDLSDMHPDELDALIKPVRIMNKTNNSLTTSIAC